MSVCTVIPMMVPRCPAQASAPPPGSTPADPWFVLAALLTVAAATAEERDAIGAPLSDQPHGEQVGQRPGPCCSGQARRPPRARFLPAGTFVIDSPPSRPNGMYAVNQRHRRQISSATDMRFLHISGAVAVALIPDILAYQVTRPGRKKALVRLGGQGRPAFASQVLLVDEAGREWPVLFRTYVTGTQYHRRLTDGWRPFAAAHALRPGDAVVLWREAGDERWGALVMRIQVERGVYVRNIA